MKKIAFMIFLLTISACGKTQTLESLGITKDDVEAVKASNNSVVSYSEGTNHTLTPEQAQAFAKQMKRSTSLVEVNNTIQKTEPSPVASASVKPSPSATPTPSTSPSPLKK